MRIVARLVLALCLVAPSAALACKKGMNVPSVTLADGAKLSKEKRAVFVDANGPETRAKYGVIPGAMLLSSYDSYDADKELPKSKDQKLIFYCAAQQCSASHDAAMRAMAAGYTDVSVLPDGIKGWKAAGLPVQPRNQS